MFDNKQSSKNNGVDLTEINQNKPYPFTPVKKLSGLKSPVEDMLAGTENNLSNNIKDEKNKESAIFLKETPQVPLMTKAYINPAKPAENNSQFQNNIANNQTKKSPFIFLIIFLIVLILASAGFFAYKYLSQNTNSSKTNINKEESDKKLETLLNNLKNTSNEKKSTEDAQVNTELDTDADGLTDAEELELGTNPAQKDTDFDGLDDSQEINIYKTDPAKQDTDADGYNDGVEVKNGFDPASPGEAKLKANNVSFQYSCKTINQTCELFGQGVGGGDNCCIGLKCDQNGPDGTTGQCINN
ncbi:MAG TPA: hypothetical protein PLK76_02485 [bacterium]|mgnify:CR=1 FL=1|nr:hypothetical protein [bacterium]